MHESEWLVLCFAALFCVPVQLSSLHLSLDPRPGDTRRYFMNRNPLVRVFGGCPVTVDITSDYMLKGGFQDSTRLRNFLSELLIGDDKIFSPDTKLINISHIMNENIQDAPNHVANNFLLDIVLCLVLLYAYYRSLYVFVQVMSSLNSMYLSIIRCIVRLNYSTNGS